MNMIHELCIEHWISDQSHEILLVVVVEYALNDHFTLGPHPQRAFSFFPEILFQGSETKLFEKPSSDQITQVLLSCSEGRLQRPSENSPKPKSTNE